LFFPYTRIVSDNAVSSNGLPALCLDADYLGLDKVKRRLTDYLVVVRLRALIAQDAEMEQVKAQKVALRHYRGPEV
jgi:hypothetical protein